MKLRIGLLATSMLIVTTIAQAQPVNGLYIGGGLGYNMLNKVSPNSLTVGGTPRRLQGTPDGNGGFVGLGSVGWGFGNGFRMEVEGNYRAQDFTLNGLGAGNSFSGGRQSTYGVMVNGLYDFDFGNRSFYPYLGAGVGYEISALRGTVAGPGLNASLGGSKGDLGVQGIAGVGIPIGVPGLSLTAEYRFLARPQSDNNNITVNGVAGNLNTGSQYNHSFLVGLRYAFGVPVMVASATQTAVAAPAPAAARTYLVFFDWDRADLSGRARQIIADAAGASSQIRTTRIEVSGNADRSGTAAYNLVLSQKRADVVASELVRLGVSKQAIYVTANGETKPIVPTADGVREPQNRNVEIVLK